MLGSNLVDLIKFFLEDFIRGSIAKDFSGKAVTPYFYISNLLTGKVIYPVSLGNESPDQPIMPFYCTLITRGIRMGILDKCIGHLFQFCKISEFRAVIGRDGFKYLTEVFAVNSMNLVSLLP